jgi:hypothetical protein
MSMCEESDSRAEDLALASAMSQRVGWYRYYFRDERWEWSAETEALHGYEPGTVEPTTDLLQRHQHSDDLEPVSVTLERVRHTDEPFSVRHRILTVQNEVRDVLVIGERLQDDHGAVIGAHGFYIDVTPDGKARDVAITEAVSEIAGNRAIIEQVKGILRIVYGIDSEAAFGLLRWRSQETNVKLRALAEQLMLDFEQFSGGENLPSRATFDKLLMTAHQRVEGASTQDA